MKKSVRTLAAAASVLAMAGAAHAATIDINIYGASAQYLYWTDAADNFLTAKGCTGVTQAAATDGKHGITTGTCSGNTVNIRYTSKNSIAGIQSVKGGNTDGCAAYQAKFASSVSAPNTLSCLDVTLGASDVAGESFVQESHGVTYGPRGDDSSTANNDIVLTGEDASSLVAHRPLVVPFGFFVNSAVTQNACKTGSPSNAGGYCQSDADCGGTLGQFTYCDGSAKKTIDNLSRLQAVNIFSGFVTDWSDLGDYYTAKPVVACFRHAGSGTHATLDFAVVRGNGWGNVLPSYESAGAPVSSGPSIWFNEGSSDEIKCVNGNYKIGSNPEVTGSLIGAVGYADADQSTGVSGTSQNVVAIKYNGFYGTRYNVRNGAYDFWSKQYLYENEARTTAAQDGWIDNLIAHASTPANVPSTKTKYWATQGELNFEKDSDQGYPYYTGAGSETP